MRKVFIIYDLFPPALGPHMGYLCKYLRQYGWESMVLTEQIDQNTFAFLANHSDVTYINFYTARNRFIRKLQWMTTLLLNLLSGNKDARIYWEACKLVRKNRFELILCSSFRTFLLAIFCQITRKYNLPLVGEFEGYYRTVYRNEFMSHQLSSFFGLNKLYFSIFKWKSLRERNQVLKKADYVTTVSPWHVETLKQFNPNVGLIYNGFDPELFYPEQKKTDKFIITYTGRLMSTAMRDPGLLLEALKILSDRNIINKEECRVYWYVDTASQRLITAEADKAGVLSFMDFKEYVQATKIPSILNNSSVLLLLANRSDDKGPKGIMTTKFFESLAVEKPVLCVRSDESYLEAALRESKAGIAARHVEEVCSFLEECFAEWKEKGYTTSHTDKNVLRKYSRKEQARQFADIFQTVIIR